MALKIFISSVSGEFERERQELREEIDKLHDLFVGMELFGSDPAKPADYCINKVEESDLYVGLFGDRYGSIEEQTKKSFTELEYEAAINKSIPCLIYFKGVMPSDKEAKSAATDSCAEDPVRAYKLIAPTAFCPIKLRRDNFSTTVSSFARRTSPWNPQDQIPNESSKILN